MFGDRHKRVHAVVADAHWVLPRDQASGDDHPQQKSPRPRMDLPRHQRVTCRLVTLPRGCFGGLEGRSSYLITCAACTC